MTDEPSGACHVYLQDHFCSQLDSDLAAALNAAKGMLTESLCLVTCVQMGEAVYLAVRQRFRALGGGEQKKIHGLLGELVPVANPAAVFGASCAHAAADRLLGQVATAHQVAGLIAPAARSEFATWVRYLELMPFALPDTVAIGSACERESLMAQAERRRNRGGQAPPVIDEVDLPLSCWEKVFDCGATKARSRLATLKALNAGKGIYRVKVAALSDTEQARMRKEHDLNNDRALKRKPAG